MSRRMERERERKRSCGREIAGEERECARERLSAVGYRERRAQRGERERAKSAVK